MSTLESNAYLQLFDILNYSKKKEVACKIIEKSALNDLQEAVRRYMEGVFPLKVPLIVTINIGKNWEEC